jgi:hypothetical protein
MYEIEIDHVLTEELERPQDLGTEIDTGSFYAAIGDQPIAYPLRTVYQSLGKEIPPLELYKAYELWVVPHRVSIIRRRGVAEVTAVGIEVKYETSGKTCCVKSLLPSYKFVERGSLAMNVAIGGNGEANPSVGLPAFGLAGASLAQLGDLSIHAKVEGELKVQFHAVVATPDIQAVGEGSSRCEWRFDHDREPLYGRDIQTWAVLVLPRRQRELYYSMRFYLNIRTFFFSTRRESDWKEKLMCPLGG